VKEFSIETHRRKYNNTETMVDQKEAQTPTTTSSTEAATSTEKDQPAEFGSSGCIICKVYENGPCISEFQEFKRSALETKDTDK